MPRSSLARAVSNGFPALALLLPKVCSHALSAQSSLTRITSGTSSSLRGCAPSGPPSSFSRCAPRKTTPLARVSLSEGTLVFFLPYPDLVVHAASWETTEEVGEWQYGAYEGMLVGHRSSFPI